MEKIYLVSTLNCRDKMDVRCWGFFLSLADAEETILKNDGDILENGTYDFALIEEVEPGLACFQGPVEHWYSIKLNDDNSYKINKCDKPYVLKSVVCFGMG